MIQEDKTVYKLYSILVILFVFTALYFGLENLQTIGTPLDWDFVKAPYFIWSYRLIDLMIQAFIVFATVAAISAMLREEKIGFVEEQEAEE
ncbi:MAG: hypothetical protein ACUVQ8_05140 [Nitrososphaeria archaeon]